MRRRHNQSGHSISGELILLTVVAVIGLIVSLQSLRTGVVTELADLGEALGNVSQTYSTSGVAGHHASDNGSLFLDRFDTCEAPFGGVQSGTNSRCVTVCVGGLAPVPPTQAEDAPPLPPSS